MYVPLLGADGEPVRDENGRRRYDRQWITAPTLREFAKRKQTALDARDAEHDGEPTDPQMLLSDLYRLVKERHVDRQRPKTQQMWHAAVVKRIAPHFFHLPLSQITTELVDAWMTKLQQEIVRDTAGLPVIDPTTGKPKRAHGDPSINRARTCLVKTLNLGKRWHKIGERNAAEHADRLPESTRVPDIYTPHQVLSFAIASWTFRDTQIGRRGYARENLLLQRAARDAAMIWVLGFGGMRIGELVALQWKDVGETHLRVAKQQDYSKADHLGPVKSKHGFRSMPMLNEVIWALEEWRAVAPFTGRNDFIFSGEPDTTSSAGRRALAERYGRVVVARKHTSSTMIDVNGWRSRSFIPIVEIAGYPDARPHALRHTFVTTCKDFNVPAKDVADWIGDTEEVVNKIYTHASGAAPKVVFNRMSAEMWN